MPDFQRHEKEAIMTQKKGGLLTPPVFITLLITNVVSLALGSLLSYSLLGGGLGYFAALKEFASFSHTARAASAYYFSDCATGGSGTISDPFCLDPDTGGSTLKRSFEFLVDGTGPEVAAGDTIYLCAGACDGSGTGTYYLDGHSSSGSNDSRPKVIDADIGGTSAAWITVQAYPGENVIMSGDSNANNAWETTEPATFFLNQESQTGFAGFGFWRFKDFTVEKFSGRAIEIQRLDTGKEIEFDNMTIRYVGADAQLGTSPVDTEAYYAPITGDGGAVAMNCSMSQLSGPVGLDTANLFTYSRNRGSLLHIKNSRLYQSCAAMLRINNNCFDASGNADWENCTNPGGVLFEDNTIYSTGPAVNGHQGGNWTFKRNTIYDVDGGISVEEHVRNITIEDNDISCRGTYKVRSNGYCNSLIHIVDGDGPGDCSAVDQPDPCTGVQCACATHTVSIKRNKVWSSATATASARSLIEFQTHNVTANAGGGVNTVIENNMIWGQLSPNDCFPSGGATDYYRAGEYGLVVASEDPVIIRNNTVYGNKCGVLVRSGFLSNWGGTAAVNHIIEGNISIDMNQQQALRIESSAGGSTFRDNIFHQGTGSAANALHFNGITYACSTVSFPGTNNRCVQPALINTGGSKNSWNLHLAATDTLAKDMMTNATGAVNDIDNESRPSSASYDIGADEIIVAAAPDTTPPIVSMTAPANNASVSGASVTVTASATDAVGVVGVQFKLDGSNLSSEDTSSPYSITWNASAATNGSHTLTATARDAAGNTSTATNVVVTVTGGLPATYYFSDCASGGAGTLANPYCLDPDSDSDNDSVGYLFDGSGPESTPGDTINLCAGACNGSGTARYPVSCSGAGYGGNYWLRLSTNASSNPITIQSYAGENVTISGDNNNNGVYDGTNGSCSSSTSDLDQFVVVDSNVGGYTWKNLTFARHKSIAFDLGFSNGAGGPWMFDGVTIQETGAVTWGDTDGIGTSACDAVTGPGQFGIYLWGQRGNFTFQNGKIHTNCGMVFRNISGSAVNYTYLVQNSEFWNLYQLSNDWGVYDWSAQAGQTTIYRNNYIHDFYGGIGIEDRARNVTIEDNTFACLGQYDVSSNQDYVFYTCSSVPDSHNCANAINIGGTDYSTREDSIADYTVRRNKIYGVRTNGDACTLNGWLNEGIKIDGGCRTSNSGSVAEYGCLTSGTFNNLVENNIVWQTYPRLSGNSAGIDVDSNMADIVRNNTLYRTDGGIKIDDGSGTGGGPIVRNNWIFNSGDSELTIGSTATGLVQNNNLYALSGNVFTKGGITYTNSTLAAGLGNGNKSISTKGLQCDSTTFCSIANIDETTWDLHLLSNDSVNKDAGTSFALAASDDFDKMTRSANGSASDIGADELVAAAGGGDTTPPTVSLTAPANGATVSGTTVTVSANASDSIGVAGVQFKLDGADLGTEDISSPYSMVWNSTGATNGSHTLTATARDVAGNTATATNVSVTVSNTSADTTPPAVSITAPAGGSSAVGAVNVTATASDVIGVVGVQFKLDGANLGNEDTNSPYSISWDSLITPNGAHTLTATARDVAGNNATATGVSVTVANGTSFTCTNVAIGKTVTESGTHYGTAVPSLVADGITDNANFFWAGVGPQSVTIDLGQDYSIDGLRVRPYGNSSPTFWYAAAWNAKYALASAGPYSDFTGITKVAGGGTLAGPGVAVTNGWPSGSNGGNSTRNTGYEQYSFSVTPVTARYIRVQITQGDNGNDSNIDEIQVCGVVASDTTQPTVSITSPSASATVSGTITVTANASDNIGVAGVQFKLDGANLGTEDTNSPYGVSWDTTSATNAPHTLSATVRDSAGNTSSATAVSATVSNAVPDTQAPSVPASTGASAVSTTQINLSWSASTDNISVSSYTVYSSTASGGPFAQTGSTAGTSYSVTGLNPSTTYYFRVRAVDAVGNSSSDSATANATTLTPPDTTPPATVTGFSATAFSSQQINLSWNATTDAIGVTGYKVLRSTTNGGPYTQVATPSATSFSDVGLTPQTTYYYVVQAYDAAGNTTPNSAQATATTPNVPDTTPPNITIISVPNVGATTAAVGWRTNEPADGIVFYGTTTSYGQSTVLNTSLITIHSASISGLNSNTLYHYQIRSRDAAGNTVNSADQTFTTSSAGTVDTVAPATVTGLTATTFSSTQINLSWSASTDNVAVTGYKVLRSTTNGGPYTQIATPVSTSYSDVGLTPGTAYYYVVQANDTAGNTSSNSTQANATTGAAPDTTAPVISGVAVASVAQTTATVSWTTDESADTQVEYGLTSSYGSFTTIDTNLALSHSQNLTGLIANTTYHYSVKSKDAAGNTASSSESTFTTLPVPPVITVTPPTGGGGGGVIPQVPGPVVGTPTVVGKPGQPTGTQPTGSTGNLGNTSLTQAQINEIIAQAKTKLRALNQALTTRLLGRILLQVQSKGEAWYLDIASRLRYYLANGTEAYEALRKFGLGITDVDIEKIPAGIEARFQEPDTDADGLPDKMEEGLGTDPANPDSDGDGFKDGDEVKSGYRPTGAGKTPVDTALLNRLKGRIVLQVQKKGQAWYINPVDGKRYYMTNGEAAYQIMRYLSLGITDNDIDTIGIGQLR